jgi:transcription termination factor NusB
MSTIQKLFSILVGRRSVALADDDELSEAFKAATQRLNTAQSDFERVVKEVLDQNERLRARHADHQSPRSTARRPRA